MALDLYSGSAPVAGSSVTVYLDGTLTLADLYEDLDGLVPLANPFTADAVTGSYRFVAEVLAYDVVLGVPADPPTETAPSLPEIRFNGTSPDRTATLVVDDPSTGEQIVLAQVVY